MDGQEDKVPAEQEKQIDNLNNKSTFVNAPKFEHKSSGKGTKKWLLAVIVLIVVLAVGGFIFKRQIKSVLLGSVQPTPSPVATPAVTPTPTPNPLVKSEWSFEILNGSGAAGLAKTVATKIQDAGYQVVKTGNADKSNYPKTEIFVKKDLQDKVDLVIADLKDTIKIASVAGELKEGTASARIIIGKDSI